MYPATPGAKLARRLCSSTYATTRAVLPSLFDCGTVNREAAIASVNDVSTGVLEETLY